MYANMLPGNALQPLHQSTIAFLRSNNAVPIECNANAQSVEATMLGGGESQWLKGDDIFERKYYISGN
jgi:hypothetical protein